MHLNIINNIPIAPKSLSLPCAGQGQKSQITLWRWDQASTHFSTSNSQLRQQILHLTSKKKHASDGVMGHLVQKARVVVWLIKYLNIQVISGYFTLGARDSPILGSKTVGNYYGNWSKHHKTVYQSSMIIIYITQTHIYTSHNWLLYIIIIL